MSGPGLPSNESNSAESEAAGVLRELREEIAELASRRRATVEEALDYWDALKLVEAARRRLGGENRG